MVVGTTAGFGAFAWPLRCNSRDRQHGASTHIKSCQTKSDVISQPLQNSMQSKSNFELARNIILEKNRQRSRSIWSDHEVIFSEAKVEALGIFIARTNSLIWSKTPTVYLRSILETPLPEFLQTSSNTARTETHEVDVSEPKDSMRGIGQHISTLKSNKSLSIPREISHETLINMPQVRPQLSPVPSPPSSNRRSLNPSASTLLAKPDTQLGGTLHRDWPKIKKHRADIQRLRSQAQEVRNMLRHKQQLRSEADDKYIRHVRESRNRTLANIDDASGIDSLELLFRNCEHIRDECGPLEDDYIALENDLSYHEFELGKLENRFYERSGDSHSSDINEVTDDIPESPASSVYIDSEIEREYHPLVYKYLSKLGELNNLDDRIDWQEEEKFNLEEEKRVKALVGLSLAEEAQNWLDNYSKLEKTLLEQITKVDTEAGELRKKCFAKGLVDDDGEPTDLEAQERYAFINDETLEHTSATSDFVNFPTLLPRPRGIQEGFHDPRLDQEACVVDPRDRINGWLLHQLRMSALEVNRLAVTYESNYGKLNDGEKWEVNVLELWYTDGAKEGEGKSGRTIVSVSSGEITEGSDKQLVVRDGLEKLQHRRPIEQELKL